jgi:hypothetical protein
MQQSAMRRGHPELKALVVEASRALARLDADRLEELALSCEALNRDLLPMSCDLRVDMVRQSHAAAEDMVTLSRVLDATRSNLNVMNRLRELHEKRIEYSDRELLKAAGMRSEHGDN